MRIRYITKINRHRRSSGKLPFSVSEKIQPLLRSFQNLRTLGNLDLVLYYIEAANTDNVYTGGLKLSNIILIGCTTFIHNLCAYNLERLT